MLHITKTCLYNFDPLKPHFYIVKLGFTGVYIIFLISVQNIDCGYSLEPLFEHRLWVLVRTASEAVLTSTHNLCFEQKYKKCQSFLSEIFQFLEMKYYIYLNRHVFVMMAIPVSTDNIHFGFGAKITKIIFQHYTKTHLFKYTENFTTKK